MKYKSYPQYKESGVEWIGKIPEQWTTNLIQECYEYRSEKVSDKYFPPLSVTKNGVVPQLENAAKTNAHDNRKKVLKGDFAINSRSDRKGSCGVSNYDGSISLIYHVLKPRNKQIENFSHSLFKDIMFSEEFYKWGHGIVDDLWTTQYAEMKKISIPIPPFDEVDIISNNLEKITNNLKKQIDKNQQLITLLKEKRKTLINQTVTKGLNPDTAMKESGIDIIGNIPKHWNMHRLKYLCDIKTGDKDTVNNNPEGKYPFYVRSPNIERIDTFTFDGIAVLMAGDGVGAGKVFHYVNGKFDFHQRVYNFHNFKKIKGKYFYYYMSSKFSEEIEKGSAKSTVDSVRLPMLENFHIPIPSNTEQEKIINYLDKKTKNIDKTIEKIEKNIELLEEYKESLIHHVVTGKIDVRSVKV